MADLKLETIDPVQVAYIELRGPYENFGRGLMDLVSWLERKRVRVAGPPIGLYYDNPTETPPEKLRAEACVPIYGDVRPEGPYKVKVLSGGLVAVTAHTAAKEEARDEKRQQLENENDTLFKQIEQPYEQITRAIRRRVGPP